MLTENIDDAIGGFWRRFWAYFIDIYAVLGILAPIGYITYVTPREIAFLIILSTTFSGVIYFIYTHYKWGQSVGKIILGLKVQTLIDNPLSFAAINIEIFCRCNGCSSIYVHIYFSDVFNILL